MSWFLEGQYPFIPAFLKGFNGCFLNNLLSVKVNHKDLAVYTPTRILLSHVVSSQTVQVSVVKFNFLKYGKIPPPPPKKNPKVQLTQVYLDVCSEVT